MDTNQQIEQLNERVKLRIAPSSIHGVGVFAVEDIKKGDKMYADDIPTIYNLPYAEFDKLKPNIKQLLLERWPRIMDGSRFAYPDIRFTAYMNHSYEPNYDNKNDVALRDIKAGEEVTEDYRVIPNSNIIFPWL